MADIDYTGAGCLFRQVLYNFIHKKTLAISLDVHVINGLVPCARQEYQAGLIENFSRTNRCGGCYVSMRTNTEKALGFLIKDGISVFRQKQRLGKTCWGSAIA
jgi:hypothetical protein